MLGAAAHAATASAPRFAVIGYGKLGGKELGYASDLDIIFLYDDADERAPENYARLAQRINNWLTARTSAGVLFETDLRLRPTGASGLLVSSLDALSTHTRSTRPGSGSTRRSRARASAPGDARGRRGLRGDPARILRRARDPAALRARGARDAREACTTRTRTARACST